MLNENILEQIKDTIEHKKLVMDSGYKMCLYLFHNNKDELAFKLLNRISIHDNSKFSQEELFGLSSISNKKALTNPNILLSDEQQQIVKIHWKNNKHHPEYFNNFSEMDEIDIIEMCCDWHARSIQYKTNLIEFVNIRQINRFNFSQEMYNKILEYCNILMTKI